LSRDLWRAHSQREWQDAHLTKQAKAEVVGRGPLSSPQSTKRRTREEALAKEQELRWDDGQALQRGRGVGLALVLAFCCVCVRFVALRFGVFVLVVLALLVVLAVACH